MRVPSGLDEYGGFLDLPVDGAGGRFGLAPAGGRWWLRTPAGHAFTAFATARVAFDGEADPALGATAYEVLLAQDPAFHGVVARPDWGGVPVEGPHDLRWTVTTPSALVDRPLDPDGGVTPFSCAGPVPSTGEPIARKLYSPDLSNPLLPRDQRIEVQLH